MENKTILGKELERRAINMAALARQLGISRNHMAGIAKGTVPASKKVKEAIAKRLDLPSDYLFPDRNEP